MENNHFTVVPLFFCAKGTFQNLNEMQVMLDEEDPVTSEKTSALIFEVTSNLLDSFSEPSYIEKLFMMCASSKNIHGLKEMIRFLS